MSDDHVRDEALLALVQGLVAMRQFPSSMLAATTPVAPPAGLDRWLTHDEAERAALLEDARWWFARPKPFGLGLEVELLPWRLVVEDGLQVISPLEFRLTWVETMNPFDQPVQSIKDALARVTFEDGSWRVAAFWTATERERHHRQLARVRAHLDGAAPNPPARPHLDQDTLRARFVAPDLYIHVAAQGDGSPDIAHGDTFVFARKAVRDDQNEPGTPSAPPPGQMPFATIVTKDYPGFDEASRLDGSGHFRLNLNIGRDAFMERFGFAARDFDQHRHRFDFTALDTVMPHPLYGANGWVSIVAPRPGAELDTLIALAIERARRPPTP